MLKTAILEQGIAIEYADELGGALGTSSGGCIRLLNGLSPAMEFTTLVHEHAHELLHRADDRPASRDTRELEAEAVAFVVGGAVGLNTSRRITGLHPALPRRPRSALGFVGPHPARGVSHSEGRQRRRITSASQRPAGASIVRRLGERLTIGQFVGA